MTEPDTDAEAESVDGLVELLRLVHDDATTRERERCARICEALTIGDEDADANMREAIAAIRDGAEAE